MKRLIAVVCYLLLFSASGVNAQTPHVLGLWQLNLETSRLPDQLKAMIGGETRSYTLREDGYLVVLGTRFFTNGYPDFIQVAAKSDGQDYPQYQSGPLAEFQINGTPTPYTYAEIVTGEYSAEVTGKYNGQIINKGTRTISADGQTMTLDVIAYQGDGTELPFVLVFDRKGG